jgi:hypothetical protein
MIRQPQMAYLTRLVLPTVGTVPNKLHESLKLIDLHPTLYILVQKAECIIRAVELECFWHHSKYGVNGK